jgi:signal transduction histidine kinase/DNA-binding response OmpR family regulator
MTPEAERLHTYLRSSAPFGPIGIVIVVSFWWYWGLSHFAVLFVGIVGYTFLVFYGLRLCRENRLQPAVLCYATGTWFLSLALGILLPFLYALSTMVAVLPVVIAVTYADRTTLLRVILASTGIVLVGALFTWFPPFFATSPLMAQAGLYVGHATVVVLVAQVGLSVWHSHRKLGDVIDEMRDANQALQASERSLERKVAERTAELGEKNLKLEESQDELGVARDDALKANEAKSHFLANMSHELRTPLNAIIGYSEMLQEEAQDDGNDSYVPDLQRILSSGRYLLTLINGVLDLSKIEAGKMDVFVETFDVGELVRGVEGTVQPLVREKENSLQVQGLEGVGAMHSDVTKVRQVLFNLLSNASKFTSRGTVTLEVAREAEAGEDWLRFSVQDTGIGMTRDQLDKVFEAFAQADASTTREYGGTGLGLSITQRFCELLGGSIEASSEPGRGSRFDVRLPAQAPQARAVAPRDTSSTAAGADTPRVLVVDDDAAARDLIGRFLAREGYDVAVASGGEEALRMARESRPDIITLDVIMPHVDGWTVLSELKEDPALSQVPVILLTMTDDRKLGYALGAAEFINKPIDWELFSEVLHRYDVDRGAPALVVDDDPMARDMLKRALERESFTVVQAENGRVALERVEEMRPSLILLDLMMPEMDGFDFLAQLRRRPQWQSIPVVVVTAKSLDSNDRARLNGNVARILQKGSYEREELLAEVRRLVGDRAPASTVG